MAADRISDSVHRELRQRILRGDLAPGMRLSDAALAIDLQTSRAPVREALRRLEAEELVVSRPNRGSFVRVHTVSDVVNLHELRVVLETAAVEFAIQRNADPSGLELIIEQMRDAAAADDMERVVELDLRFHEGMVTLSGNNWLLKSFRQISTQIQMILSLEAEGYAGRLERMADDHVPLVRLLDEGTPQSRIRPQIRSHALGRLPELLRHFVDDDVESDRLRSLPGSGQPT